jgi:hypothetical protein
MSQNSNFQAIANKIKSGKDVIQIRKNFDRKDSLHFMETIINALQNKSCKIRYLSFQNINMVFSEDAIKLLTNFLKTNKTIISLELNMSYENTKQAFKDIGSMFAKNKTITTFILTCENPDTGISNVADKNMKYLTEGLERSKLEKLSFFGTGLTSKGASEVAKLIRNPATNLTNVDIANNYISKNAFTTVLLPAIRKNVTLTEFEMFRNIEDDDEEESMSELIELELEKNKLIQILFSQYSTTKKQQYYSGLSGFFTKTQQQYIKGKSNSKGKVQNFNNVDVPLDIRLMIHQFMPRNLRNNIDSFIEWINQNYENTPEIARILRKLRYYKKLN